MSELEDKLESILGNPQAMEQIMSLAQSLGGGNSASQTPPPPASPQPAPAKPSGGLLDGLSQLDPRILSGAAQLMSQYNSSDDRRVALLNALRPFVKEQRYAKLDKAIQIAKLSRLARMALDLLHTREDGHV